MKSNNDTVDPILYYKFIVKEDLTIRQIANKLGISKSKVHKQIHELNISNQLKSDIQIVLNRHYNNKHVNGGKATKRYWMN